MREARFNPSRSPNPLRWFVLAVGLFYTVWLIVVTFGSHGDTLASHWPIAAAMLAGSYVAGSTPMGGGTVGFPILVLLMDQPAALGRDFSLAVQSVGMTSASLYILCTRQPLEWPMLRAALVGTLIGTPLGILCVAPWISGLTIKLLFAVIWGSFGLLHLQRMNEITAREGITPTQVRFDTLSGGLVGFFGGLMVASVTGVGIDMMIYVVLVLLCHADLRIAISTSVVLMAATSVVGILTKLIIGDIAPGVWANWLAAAPIVVLGAPFGALMVRRIGRRVTLWVVSALCVGQFFWTLWHERDALGWSHWVGAILGLVLFLLVFQELRAWGDRLARRKDVDPGSSI